jgi:hypothetical protein
MSYFLSVANEVHWIAENKKVIFLSAEKADKRSLNRLDQFSKPSLLIRN